MKQTKFILVTIMLIVNYSAHAHKRWILPSIFNVSDTQWVAVDATVSNNIFYPDIPWPINDISVTTPTGGSGQIENKAKSHRRNSFDVHINETGTYKITSKADIFFASFSPDANKTDKKSMQHMRNYDFNTLKAQLPKNASNVLFSKSASRLETYVTLDAPNTEAFKPSKSGIELIPVTHPNDLYESESATFQFLFNGKKATGLNVSVIWDGTRHRDQEQAINLKTNENGEVTINLDKTGRFLLETSHAVKTEKDNQFSALYFSYLGTFEVLPQ